MNLNNYFDALRQKCAELWASEDWNLLQNNVTLQVTAKGDTGVITVCLL